MIRFFHVDAFTDRPMQQVAREMNVSETAFVTCGARLPPSPRGARFSSGPRGAGFPSRPRGARLQPCDPAFPLRWFTPLVEVDLCGHATLAAAHVLWETGRLAADAVARFSTRSGELTAVRRDEWIELDFPAVTCEPTTLSSAHLASLGIASPRFVGLAGPRHIVEVESEAAVRRLDPDFHALRALPGRGIAVTAPSAPPYDFVSRYFAPWVGVNEDPVTGSVHCGLATYWAGRLGKQELIALQASPRGGELRLRVDGDRVRLGGKAVTVAEGTLRVGSMQ